MKILETKSNFHSTSDITVHSFNASDINAIVNAFQQANWQKPVSTFENYLYEQERGECIVWVAKVNEHFVGYITLKWRSQYEPFSKENIPEIKDLNVLPEFRKLGVGSMLLDMAENEASVKAKVVGIGVGLYGQSNGGGYGAAQKLYVKRGYIPDGNGITYNYKVAEPGQSYPLDDDMIFWFTKKLR